MHHNSDVTALINSDDERNYTIIRIRLHSYSLQPPNKGTI